MAFFSAVSGTLLNALTVLIGGTIGTIVGSRFSERFANTLFIALGLFTTVTGIGDALKGSSYLSIPGGFHIGDLVALGGLLIGGLIGEALQIERGLERLGAWAQARLQSGSDRQSSRIGQGFVTATLLFCVGPLTILGSISNGLTGDIRDLTIKSMLDGFAALALSATLGWGVLLSIISVLVIQGGLSLGAGTFKPLIDANSAIIPELVTTGGFLLIGVGLRLLKIADLKPGNFLPALIVTPVLVVILTALPWGITP